MYTILKPFNANGMSFRRGQFIQDDLVDNWKNKRTLLHEEYIEKRMDPDTYVVHRPFVAGGKRWKVGEVIHAPKWRNVASLLGSGYLQRKPHSEGVSPTAPSAIWKNRDWLAQRYLVEGCSPVAIAKEAGCSVGTLYHWLHKYGLKEPGWRKHRRKTEAQ